MIVEFVAVPQTPQRYLYWNRCWYLTINRIVVCQITLTLDLELSLTHSLHSPGLPALICGVVSSVSYGQERETTDRP
jgi:hypothetical protein